MDMTLEQFTEALERLAAEHPDRVRKKIVQTGWELIREIKLNAPVGNYSDGTKGGRLRDSFNNVRGPFRTLEGYNVRLGSNVEYAAHVEYGHVTRLGMKKDKAAMSAEDASTESSDGSADGSADAEETQSKKKSYARKENEGEKVGFVPGQFFVRKSVDTLGRDLPDDINRWVEETLKELLR